MSDDRMFIEEPEQPEPDTLYFLVQPLGEHGLEAPKRGTPDAAGYDLRCNEDVVIQPGRRAVIDTGFAIRLPRGTYGRIAPRSGLAVQYGLDVLAGVVDSDYRGQVKVVLVNHGERPFTAYRGDRIAQLIITPTCNYLEPFVVSDLEGAETSRGSDGFGSTGVH